MKKDFSRLMVSIFYSFLGLSLLMLTSCGGGVEEVMSPVRHRNLM